jgi:hypothetical protein
MRINSVCVLLLATLLVVGCTQNAWVTAPSQVPAGSLGASVSAPTGPPVAVLAITTFDVQEQPGSGSYLSTLVLEETGGQSAATLQSVYLSIEQDSCSPGASTVVPAGGSATVPVPSWCFDGDITDKDILLVVTFSDEAGRKGTVQSVTKARSVN